MKKKEYEIDSIFDFIEAPEEKYLVLGEQTPENKKRLTLYVELDDILCYTYLPDEATGNMANLAVKGR